LATSQDIQVSSSELKAKREDLAKKKNLVTINSKLLGVGCLDGK
jgi:hypothetical protein